MMTALLRCCGKGYAFSVINMANIVTCKTKDGETVQYVDEVIGSGSMKDVYFSPDKSYVVAFYHKPQNEQARDRIDMITGRYRQNIFGQSGGEYWKDLFCWPTHVVEHGHKIGIVVPTYKSYFFFKYGSKTSHLSKEDPNRVLPSITTDRHALSVLIYMYLFFRHPLRGGKIHDMSDEVRDETLSMGEKALFIEHPTDKSNAVKVSQLSSFSLPWADPEKIPYTIMGPYLTPLFERAFIDGLHDATKRPTADEWESALVKTVDLIQPCQNKACEQKWYVFSGKTKPVCPYCGTPYKGKLPVLNLYSSRKEGSYRPDDHRLMVWSGQSIYAWHVNRLIAPNERTTDLQRKRVGYFVFHNDQWWLVNEGINGLMSLPDKRQIAIGEKIELTNNAQFVLSKEEGGRLVVVQLVEN